MRRIVSVAFVAVFLMSATALFAQHGGGGHAGGFGGGHAGGFGGGYVGHGFGGGFSRPANGIATFGPHSFSAAPGGITTFGPGSFSSAPRVNSPGFARGFAPGYRGNWSGDRGRGRDHDGDHRGFHYRSPYRGYGYGNPYLYNNSWQLLPWDLGYPDFTGYNGYGYDNGYDDPSADQQAPAGTGQQQPAESEPPAPPPDTGYRPEYAGPSSEIASAAPPEPAPPVAPEPELTLIFRDGHQQAIHNYVLTGSSVIVLDDAASGRQMRIPLADLNLPATEKAAQDAGLDFTPPA